MEFGLNYADGGYGRSLSTAD